jgi:flagellar motor component MotA
MRDNDNAKVVQVMDRMAERMPWWVLVGDALAVIALLAAAASIAALSSNNAKWFRGART